MQTKETMPGKIGGVPVDDINAALEARKRDNELRCRMWIRGAKCQNYRMVGSAYCALHGRGTRDR